MVISSAAESKDWLGSLRRRGLLTAFCGAALCLCHEAGTGMLGVQARAGSRAPSSAVTHPVPATRVQQGPPHRAVGSTPLVTALAPQAAGWGYRRCPALGTS